ncbi:RNA-directed DNA polymerase [Abeliophyllum distichum]|uniref:RNA-directed DNA polymerase n=1 Tax=Abeliophyllum distichum TaxID=126358 RepID=A0ABD1TYY1_9LAMI
MILSDNEEVKTVDDSDEAPELEDDGVEYQIECEILFARHALHAQNKVDDLEQQEKELDDVFSEEMSSRLRYIRDIAHQIKANKGCRFIFKPSDWVWVHVKTECILSPFDAGDDSRSNPFEERADDASHVSHGPLVHLTQTKNYIEDISETNGKLKGLK